MTSNAETIAHRICPLCEACCGLELRVSDNKVIGIRGHDEDVFSRGYICPKGASLKDLHEDPDRLRAPLIKRDGKFFEASWDEAFAEIERRLPLVVQAHGADALAMVIGNPSAHKIGLLLYFSRLAKAIGSRNMFSASTLDQMPKQLSCGLMFGNWLSFPVPDIERSDFLLMLGANPMVSNGSLWTVPDYRGKAKAMRARGGRIVVIDPRRTETALAADEHHFIRPGTDVFLLLGMVHTLFDEQLVRLGALAEHVAGVDLVKSAVSDFTPERMADRCGINAATIRTLARRLASAERAAVYGRMGTCTQEYGTLCSWLIDVLNVLTGHLDQEGGAMFSKAAAFSANTAGKPGVGRGVITGRRKSRVSGAPEVMGEFPIVCLAEEIQTPGDGQVKALISIAGNPVLSAPNGPRLSEALDGLEFMVSVDIYLNETTRHADVILPGLSPLEESHYDVAFPQFSYRNHARYSEPVLQRDPAQPPEWQVLLRLAAIVQGKGAQADVLKLDDALFAEDVRRMAGEHAEAVLAALSHLNGPERQIDLALRTGPYGDQFGRNPGGINLAKVKAAPGGIDLGPLQSRIPEVLRTPSGKIELAPEMLLADLSRVRGDLAQPAPELVVIGRRHVRSGNSWMHNLPILAKGPFRCTALVHSVDAQRLGLQSGSMARISSGGRSIEAQVEISDDMMPGVVSLPHGWGHDMPGTRMRVAAERPGANLNAILDESKRDPLSGNAVLSGVAIEMTAVVNA
ncbi:molybdopterin-dependent oxidoreductase [Noviherbaspirillum sp. Root189]|uniref:molybdopterin-dependent oxidoreductase n=1 Tax=Noviherbaspirillum sp. Root189 TaxID=1736487 RepID=UPI00070903B6|nr:molybdopterin-dependent oxidoreductase [Noviherbaspirillum sp. Root189]KRB79195.1 molybdopterin-binding oxidoreductase [Noviherbaspirillum sp. Root189]